MIEKKGSLKCRMLFEFLDMRTFEEDDNFHD